MVRCFISLVAAWHASIFMHVQSAPRFGLDENASISLVILGEAKAGTSDMYEQIAAIHSGFMRSVRVRKEIDFSWFCDSDDCTPDVISDLINCPQSVISTSGTVKTEIAAACSRYATTSTTPIPSFTIAALPSAVYQWQQLSPIYMSLQR